MNRSNVDYSIENDRFISKTIDLYQKRQFYWKRSQIRQNPGHFWLNSIQIESKIKIWIRIRIEIIATIDRTAEFGSKKSIKRRFEYDLDQISRWPWLDRISFPLMSSNFFYDDYNFEFFNFQFFFWLLNF